MADLLHQMGERIVRRRKQLGMTQEELSEAAGTTQQTISSAELGTKGLRPENILKICAALEISPDYLLLGSVSDIDHAILVKKISRLTPEQYRHFEDVVNGFIAAVLPSDDSTR